MTKMVTPHGRRHEGLRAVLSAAMVVTGTWLSGAVDRYATESDANEAIGDVDEVRTWVAESQALDAWSDEPVVSPLEFRQDASGSVVRCASARHGRES